MIKCGYCGREADDTALKCGVCGNEFPLGAPPEASLFLPPLHLIAPEAIAGAFQFAEGYHRPDWRAIGQWIESHFAEGDREAAWNEVAVIWLTRLQADLGGGYYVSHSRQTLLLCDLPPGTAQRMLDYAGAVESTLKDYLHEIAWDGVRCRDVVLIFSDRDDYYQYLAFHVPDGEQTLSAGVCIHSGYTHIALPWADEITVTQTIAHELTHDSVAHLPLPLWLNEGIAVALQKLIAAADSYASGPMMWDELAERHHAFWNEQNIQSFWAGTSFYEPGDPNELSYSLAEVFLKLISERGDGASVREFIRQANQSDAGQTAALDVLDADLGEIAGTFLGEGNWRPQRKAMVACWQTAGWEKASEDSGRDKPPGDHDPTD